MKQDRGKARYAAVAWNLVYHIKHNGNNVENATQDVVLKAFQSISSYRGGSFRAYAVGGAPAFDVDAFLSRSNASLTWKDSLYVLGWREGHVPAIGDIRMIPKDTSANQKIAVSLLPCAGESAAPSTIPGTMTPSPVDAKSINAWFSAQSQVAR